MVNLRGTRGVIIKIRARDRSGRNIHKSQFSIDDKNAVERELRFWKDKLGVPLSLFKNIVNDPIDNEELLNIQRMMKESLGKSDNKVKKAMSI